MTSHQARTAGIPPLAPAHPDARPARGTRRRLPVNITAGERAGRIITGAAAVIAGAVLLAGAGSVLAITLEALLIAAGLDLVVTGALGHCPLYHRLGYLPRSLRTRSGGPDDRTA